MGVVAAPLIKVTDFVGWTTRLFWARYMTFTVSKSSVCWLMVGGALGAWGSCGACATVRLVSSAKSTKGERRG